MEGRFACDLTRDRGNGVLMHISSLPGNTGIGTMGENAYKFVDFLKRAKQRYWQILPICPTGYGDSPYQSFSSFAGNPYFIDLDELCKRGFLREEDYRYICWGEDETRVDYGRIYENRRAVLAKVQEAFEAEDRPEYDEFCRANGWWLDDYALFMATKDEHGGAELARWEDDIRLRRPEAVHQWAVRCQGRVRFYKMLQYFFYDQWSRLKKYANDNGVYIIGDIPIYVSADSVDVWTQPKQFKLDEDLRSVEVAGCPPDAFSPTGQLWGNPLYDWEYMKQTDYEWWVNRIRKSLELYDVLRVDHFIGFDRYYCIPAASGTAEVGVWREGPGMELWSCIERRLCKVPIIAEDLGVPGESAKRMLKESGFPGMKVLQFAFNPSEQSSYLPYKYEKNCIVYTGTHDNDTLLGWIETSGGEDVEYAVEFLRAGSRENLPADMMFAAMESVANTCVLTMQDILGLGSEARMNVPSAVGVNWSWRMREDQLTEQKAEWLARYTKLYGRAYEPNQR